MIEGPPRRASSGATPFRNAHSEEAHQVISLSKCEDKTSTLSRERRHRYSKRYEGR